MQELTYDEMAEIQGGVNWKCIRAIAGTTIWYGSLFAVPGGAVAVGMYAISATAMPTIAGLSIVDACFS